MSKICTSIEQSKKIIELGIDVSTADMYWKNGVSDRYIQCFTPFVCGDYQDGLDFDYDIPAWSLTALLDVVQEPELIRNSEGTWLIRVWYNRYPFSIGGYNNPIDACVEMILKLNEEKLL